MKSCGAIFDVDVDDNDDNVVLADGTDIGRPHALDSVVFTNLSFGLLGSHIAAFCSGAIFEGSVVDVDDDDDNVVLADGTDIGRPHALDSVVFTNLSFGLLGSHIADCGAVVDCESDGDIGAIVSCP